MDAHVPQCAEVGRVEPAVVAASEGKKRGSRGNAAAKPAWNRALAEALPGSRLLVGLTWLAADGSLIGQEQFFGIVERADSKQGIEMALEGRRAGERYTLPPDTSSIQEAMPGIYSLASGEEVLDPHFTVTYAIHKAPE